METEAQALIDEVARENEMLRKMMQISEEFTKPATFAEINATIKELENREQEAQYKAEMKAREAREKELELLKKELKETMESTL